MSSNAPAEKGRVSASEIDTTMFCDVGAKRTIDSTGSTPTVKLALSDKATVDSPVPHATSSARPTCSRPRVEKSLSNARGWYGRPA